MVEKTARRKEEEIQKKKEISVLFLCFYCTAVYIFTVLTNNILKIIIQNFNGILDLTFDLKSFNIE